MADAFHLKKPVADQIQEFAADASLAINIGDLMYLDTDDAKPAGSQADQGTETDNQRLFASKFCGVANSKRLSSDASAGVVRVQTDVLIELPCASSTFEIGDLIGGSEVSTGDALEPQTVEKVTSKDLAIGVVTKRYASATTKVWCRLQSRVSDSLGSKRGAPATTTALTTITPADAAGTPDYAIAAVTNSSPFGFSNAAEAITLLYVIKNLQVRVAELEARL